MPKSRKTFNVENPFPRRISIHGIIWEPVSRQGWGNQSAIVHSFVIYEMMQDFIKGQTCDDVSSIDWNVKEGKKGELKKNAYITSFIEHVWYECAYCPKDHRNDPRILTLHFKVCSLKKFGVITQEL